jgi:hypothetical protein
MSRGKARVDVAEADPVTRRSSLFDTPSRKTKKKK